MYVFIILFIYSFAVSLVNPDKNILLFGSSWADKNPEITNLENNWNDNKIKHFLIFLYKSLFHFFYLC